MHRRLFIALIFMSLWQCRGPEGLQSNNLSYLYNRQEVGIRPEFQVIPISDTLFTIHYWLESDNLLFTKMSDDSEYESRLRMSFQILPDMESALILDSGIVNINHRVPEVENERISGSFQISMPKNLDKVLLYVKTSDLNRGSSQGVFINVSNVNYNSASYYQLKDSVDQILFRKHIPRGLPFKLEHSILKPKFYYVGFYQREFPLALPPYSSKQEEPFDIDPDSLFLVPADSLIRLPEEGFYHFRIDTSQWEGFTIVNFDPAYPLIGNHQQMAEPLRYLTTQKEFAEMLALKDNPDALKDWIDNFWMRKGGNAERSTDLLRAFYQRVEEANRHFGSYHEGWKTDRGIVYIVYGPPNKVFRSSAGEAWVYGNQSSSLSYYFNFIHLDNPFTDNDFSLDRSSQYRYGWGQAIEAWRQGHIYNSKDIRREQDDYDQLQYRSRTPMWY
jgi:GWxTD domain-containing protein